MKLAFSGQGRYPDFTKGYRLYCSRARKDDVVNEETYRKIVREYCKILSERLVNDGMIDFPGLLGSVAAIELKRRPQYRGKKYIGFGKMDWEKGHYDGTFKTFGIGFLPKRGKIENLRCYGFVANRRLFKQVKERGAEENCGWVPLAFNDKMI